MATNGVNITLGKGKNREDYNIIVEHATHRNLHVLAEVSDVLSRSKFPRDELRELIYKALQYLIGKDGITYSQRDLDWLKLQLKDL